MVSFADAFYESNNSIDAPTGSPQQRLNLEATLASLNKDLPKMVDSITKMNKINLSDQGYTYFETITVKVDNPDVLQTLQV